MVTCWLVDCMGKVIFNYFRNEMTAYNHEKKSLKNIDVLWRKKKKKKTNGLLKDEFLFQITRDTF